MEPPDCGVCLNILRDNYQPSATVREMILGLQFLFDKPNAGDPLNKEAAEQYVQNHQAFRAKAEQYCEQFCPKD
jgi:ubiquitin-conjugating enzyme E2 M